MAERGLDVADVALECGVSRQAAHEWRRGLAFPSPRYASEMAALFGTADARRLYQAREDAKGDGRRDRAEGRALRAAANALERRGLGELARMVRREAERAVGGEEREAAA